MSPTVFNPLMVVVLGALLAGCGLTQSVADSTAQTTRAIFYKQVKTLHLDFSARTALNTDAAVMSDMSLPILVRVYQLRDDKALQRTDYDSLITQGSDRLRSDLLDERAVLVRPDESTSLDVPLHQDARFVAVAGLFRQPQSDPGSWRLILNRDELDPTQARVIDVLDNRLSLRPVAGASR